MYSRTIVRYYDKNYVVIGTYDNIVFRVLRMGLMIVICDELTMFIEAVRNAKNIFKAFP